MINGTPDSNIHPNPFYNSNLFFLIEININCLHIMRNRISKI